MRVVIIALLLRTSSRRDDEERVFERRETGGEGHVGAMRVIFFNDFGLRDEKRVPFLSFEADVRARERERERERR